MARCRIQKSEDGVAVQVDDVSKDQQSELMGAFRECQEGRCSCPTQEYRKLESLEVDSGEDGINLRLRAKDGEQIDTSEIANCLDYTIASISKHGDRTDS